MVQRRKDARRNKALMLMAFFVLLIVAGLMLSASDEKPECGMATEGDLTDVTTASGLPEEIISYEGMTVSFNPELHIPNWVAWELTGEEAQGTEPRYDTFMRDDNVEGSAYPSDYTHSGYDRGHMAPAGDMKWSQKAMEQTFYMTNICPQAGSLNRGSWKSLEEKCRSRAMRDSAIIIVCGPVLTEKPSEYIGETGVAVPKSFFKVILSPYNNPPTAIGFIMPNGYVEGGMQRCAMTVDEVERLTGHDFFSALPDEIENEVESTVNFNKWSRMK